MFPDNLHNEVFSELNKKWRPSWLTYLTNLINLNDLFKRAFSLISKIRYLPGRSAQKETEHGAYICPLESVYFCSVVFSNISHFRLVQNPQTIPLDIETYY